MGMTNTTNQKKTGNVIALANSSAHEKYEVKRKKLVKKTMLPINKSK